MKEHSTIYEEDEMVEISIAYPSDNDEYYLISNKAFEHSPENIREGQTDILMFFCGIVATVFFFSVLLTALNTKMTVGSVLLMILYLVLAVICFVSPVQVFISHKIWNRTFGSKLIVNAGASDKVMLSDKAFYYTNPEGTDERVPYNDMYGLYCVGDFLIFELEKKKICAMRLDSVSDPKIIKSLRLQVEECMLSTETMPEELAETKEPAGEQEDTGESKEAGFESAEEPGYEEDDADGERKDEADAEMETEADSESDADAETETEAEETDADAEADAETETDAETDADADLEDYVAEDEASEDYTE